MLTKVDPDQDSAQIILSVGHLSVATLTRLLIGLPPTKIDVREQVQVGLVADPSTLLCAEGVSA